MGNKDIIYKLEKPSSVAFIKRNSVMPKPVLDDPRFRIRPMQQVASACTGAVITALFMTPLDVVKTRLQAQQSTLASNKCFLYCNGLMDHLCPCEPASSSTTNPVSKPPPRLNGTVDAFIKITRSEGIGTLWSGLSPTMIAALPSTVIYFVAYEQFKAHLVDFHYDYIVKDPTKPKYVPFLVPLVSGITARTCAVAVVSPIELIRTKMQSKAMTFKEIKEAFRNVWQSQGIRGLFRGLPPTLFRDVPFSGIYWSSYESIKKLYNVSEPTFYFSFIGGAISGGIAATVTTPFDVVKTHEQIEFGEKFLFADKPSPKMPSIPLTQRLRGIYKAHGIRGLFSGLGPRLFRVAPACAIMISTFEYSKAFFYDYNKSQYQI